MNDKTVPTFSTVINRSTITLICANMDEAVSYIKEFVPSGYWAQIICVTDGEIHLHLRPLEEKDY